MSKSPITCHGQFTRPLSSQSLSSFLVLDSSTGKPAEGVFIRLQQFEVSTTGGPDIFQPLAKGYTNADGRCLDLLPPAGSLEEKAEKTALKAGQTYKIVFKTKEYFEQTGRASFYPWVEVSEKCFLQAQTSPHISQISFTIANPDEHYHIPLLISPYSYTTYRGS
ncbi:hypothetical protein DXG03_008498 [Asterophora parasitica]|uniref:hydroxyisourate hydrolase n=1 Tax=Asterophora parasitica TaxID=117018 RepID=A0A9P7KGF9_9AGAR|nr:hypothetical protein DXG03_008498 [Asterophora parasitica]